jgi:hypothetical protein
VLPTSVRLWGKTCWKVDEIASRRGPRGGGYTFHHRANWRTNISAVREEVEHIIDGARAEFDAYRTWAEQALARPVSPEQAERFIDDFVHPRKRDEELKPRRGKNVARQREQLREILASDTCEGIRDTQYGLVQAVGEWLDHCRDYQSQENQFARTMLATEPKKLRAVNISALAAQGVL